MSGICGVIDEKRCFDDLFFLADYHAHLGTRFGGMATMESNGIINDKMHRIDQGDFKTKFRVHRTELLGKYGIATISSLDKQPLAFGSRLGRFSICTSGRVDNLEEIAQQLEHEGHSFSVSSMLNRGTPKVALTWNTTEVISKIMIAENDLVAGVQRVYETIKGSLSIIILGQRGVYAVRDLQGRTPLFVGKKGRSLAVSMENFPLDQLEYDEIRMLNPGEMIRISEAGIKQKLPGDEAITKFCGFYFIYTGFPASDYYGQNVQEVRFRNGQLLAQGEKYDLDLILGMPDSGKFHGWGMAEELRIPLRECLMKYTYSWGGRSFTPTTQEEREMYGRMKIVPAPSLIRGRRIGVVDDSLVRGTQLAQTVDNKLWPFGPKEVHARLACPPLIFGCPYLQSTRTEELATRDALINILNREPEDITPYLDSTTPEFEAMVEQIRKVRNFTSLRYQTMDRMVQAIGLPKERLCTYCWDKQG